MNLIPLDVVSVLHEQFAHEKRNAYLYLYISGWLKNKGLDKLGEIFFKQYEEELEHSRIIFDLLTDLNAPFLVQESEVIDTGSLPINLMSDIATFFVEREVLTTEKLNEVRDIAITNDCSVVEQRIREMILKQQYEYEEALTFQDKVSLIGDDWKFVMLWDASL